MCSETNSRSALESPWNCSRTVPEPLRNCSECDITIQVSFYITVMSTTWTTTKLKFKFKPYFFPFILLPAPPASTMASILFTHLLSVEHGEENAVPPTVHWWLFMERWQNRWATWLPPYPFLCINLSKGSKVTSACNWMTPSSPPSSPPHIDTLLHLITTPALLNGWFCISPYQLGLLPVWWNPHLLILLPLSYLSSRITTNNNPVHPPAGSAWFPAGFVFLPSPPPFPYLLPFCPPPFHVPYMKWRTVLSSWFNPWSISVASLILAKESPKSIELKTETINLRDQFKID